jgi:glutamine synthetase
MTKTVEDARKLVKDEGVEFFLCSFVELSGAPKAKLVPATHLDDMAEEGAGFAGFAAGEIGQGPHSPDLIARPDFNSLTHLPWRKNVAWVIGNSFVEGQSWPYCPRTILSNYLERVAQEWGYTFKTGVEAEFHLVAQDEDGNWQVYDELDTLAKPCYDIRALHRNLDIMTTLVKYMQEIGWDPYANDHEDANCQFEINFTYADALTNADRHTFFKWMVKTVAEQNGLLATFMPKPFAHLTGNGAHFHMSLWDAEKDANLFDDPKDEMGLSQVAYHFCGGLMKHAKALAAITNPIVNSYKRLIRGAPNSGATWAPVYVTYGGSNRTQMIRIPAGGRVENRIVDGAANPYLAATALLAAGLDGIKNKIDPGPKNTRNLYEVPEEQLHREGIEFLPVTLFEALDHFETDEVLQDALGVEFSSMYLHAKRTEWNAYHRSVSQWELDNYIAAY